MGWEIGTSKWNDKSLNADTYVWLPMEVFQMK